MSRMTDRINCVLEFTSRVIGNHERSPAEVALECLGELSTPQHALIYGALAEVRRQKQEFKSWSLADEAAYEKVMERVEDLLEKGMKAEAEEQAFAETLGNLVRQRGL